MKMRKLLCLAMGLGMVFSAAACGENNSDNSTSTGGGTGETIKLTVWCPEADHEFAKKVAEDYKAANPSKSYKFFFGIVAASRSREYHTEPHCKTKKSFHFHNHLPHKSVLSAGEITPAKRYVQILVLTLQRW